MLIEMTVGFDDRSTEKVYVHGSDSTLKLLADAMANPGAVLCLPLVADTPDGTPRPQNFYASQVEAFHAM